MSTLSTNKIIPATSTTVTLGDSGDTFNIPAGVTLANSGTATGFGGGAWTLIGTQVASNSASLTQTGLDSTYDTYAIVISDFIPANNAAILELRVGDSGGVDSGAANYDYHCAYPVSNSANYAAENSTGADNINIAAYIGNDTGEGCGATLYLSRPGDGTSFPGIYGTYHGVDNTGYATGGAVTGMRNAVITLDRIQVLWSAGNIVSGRLSIFGIKHT